MRRAMVLQTFSRTIIHRHTEKSQILNNHAQSCLVNAGVPTEGDHNSSFNSGNEISQITWLLAIVHNNTQQAYRVSCRLERVIQVAHQVRYWLLNKYTLK